VCVRPTSSNLCVRPCFRQKRPIDEEVLTAAERQLLVSLYDVSKQHLTILLVKIAKSDHYLGLVCPSACTSALTGRIFTKFDI
jgi:hypothetical protein